MKSYPMQFFLRQNIPPILASGRIEHETLREAHSKVSSQHHQANPIGLLSNAVKWLMLIKLKQKPCMDYIALFFLNYLLTISFSIAVNKITMGVFYYVCDMIIKFYSWV